MRFGDVLRAALPGVDTGAQERSLVWPWPQDLMRYNGRSYLLTNQSYGPNEDARLTGERQALTSNGVVYGIFRARADLFSQARFVWKRYGAGPKPMAADVTTNTALRPLDNPASILEWCEIDVATTGNSYWVLDGGVLRRLPAEWVSIVLGSDREADDPQLAWDARPVGVIYKPPALPADRAETFLWSEVAHYCPERDPDARFRGMSWLRPAMEDVVSDNSARRFLTKFWENHAPQPLTARVLTPAGWSTMGQMSIGCEVIGSDGKPKRVLGVYPQGERDIYRVRFSGGAEVECTADHIWQVCTEYDTKRGTHRTLTAQQMLDDGVSYPSGANKYAVQLVEPVQFAPADPLPVDAYLLGLLLGDGNMTGNGRGSGGVSLAAHADDIEETLGLIADLLPSGVRMSRRDRKPTAAGGAGWSEVYFARAEGSPKRNALTDAVSSLGLFGVGGRDKFIPEAYLRADVMDRVRLLQGLIDSDGSIHPRQGNLVCLTTTSERLAAGLCDLVEGLGGIATPTFTKRNQYTVSVKRLPEWIVPCRLSRKVAAYRPSSSPRNRYITGIEWVRREEAQCISVDTEDSLYVTDGYVLTHNTPNNVVTFDPDKDVEEIREFRDLFLEKHQGVDRAFRTAFLGGGADIKVIGSSLKDLDAGNIRKQVHFDIALAAGINPMAVGLMEVNYSNTKEGNRSISDRKLRYLWMKAVEAFRPVVERPQGFELWYDVNGVAALQADAIDEATVQAQQANTMRTLVDGGFVPEAVMAAVTSGDWSKLQHSGLLSVQTQAPGSGNQDGGGQ